MTSRDDIVRAAEDLRLNWPSFCDCDPFEGSEDFQERMEAAGFIEPMPVEESDLEHPFAAELGIELGGLKWELTEAGRTALADAAGPSPALEQAFERYRSRTSPSNGTFQMGEQEAAELLEVAASALLPFAAVAQAHPDVFGPRNVLVGGDDRCPVTFIDLHRANDVRAKIAETLARSHRVPPEHETDSASYWRQEYKGMEQAFMNVMSEYSDVALAMGFEGNSFFGDPLADHAEIVERARELHRSHSAGWLFDNEDAGREFSESDPIESGEVPDATNVVPATAEALLMELKMAWTMLEDVRRDRDDLARIVGSMKLEDVDAARV